MFIVAQWRASRNGRQRRQQTGAGRRVMFALGIWRAKKPGGASGGGRISIAAWNMNVSIICFHRRKIIGGAM